MVKSKEYYRTLPKVNFNLAFDLEKTAVQYKLYKDVKDKEFKELTANNIAHEELNSSIPTVLIVHGWISSDAASWLAQLKDALFGIGPHNIIYLDWSKIAQEPYEIACGNIKPLGKMVADFLTASTIPVDKIYLIGKWQFILLILYSNLTFYIKDKLIIVF